MTFPINKFFYKDQKGVTLLLSLLVLSAILAISFSVSTILFIEIRSSGDLVRTEGALYGAEAVSEEVFFKVKRNVGSAFVYSSNLGQISVNTPVESNTAPQIYETVISDAQCTFSTAERFPIYNPERPGEGSQYGKVKIENVQNSGQTNLKVWVCEYRPNGLVEEIPPKFYATTPCTNVDSNEYWIDTSGNTLTSGYNYSKYQVINAGTSSTWEFNVNKQQELVIANESCTSPVLIRITGYNTDGSTIKPLPLIGETSVIIKADVSGVSRKLDLRIPKE